MHLEHRPSIVLRSKLLDLGTSSLNWLLLAIHRSAETQRFTSDWKEEEQQVSNHCFVVNRYFLQKSQKSDE